MITTLHLGYNKGEDISKPSANARPPIFAVSAFQPGNIHVFPFFNRLLFDPTRRYTLLEDEPRPPCKSCGPTNWNPQQTRRELFKNAAIAGVGITTASVLLTAPVQSHAAAIICEQIRDSCTDSCNKGNQGLADLFICIAACTADYVACKALQLLQGLKNLLDAAGQFLADHPELVAGATFVVAGVVFVAICTATGPAGCLATAAAFA